MFIVTYKEIYIHIFGLEVYMGAGEPAYLLHADYVRLRPRACVHACPCARLQQRSCSVMFFCGCVRAPVLSFAAPYSAHHAPTLCATCRRWAWSSKKGTRSIASQPRRACCVPWRYRSTTSSGWSHYRIWAKIACAAGTRSIARCRWATLTCLLQGHRAARSPFRGQAGSLLGEGLSCAQSTCLLGFGTGASPNSA